MDPNETLRQLRAATKELESLAQGDSNDAEIDKGHEVADLAAVLDEWLSEGGFLPDDWNVGRYVEFADVAGTYVHDRAEDPQDTCKEWYPDPTPNDLDVDELCGAAEEGFICTRRRGHDGRQHVAGAGDHVAHVWPWAEEGSHV